MHLLKYSETDRKIPFIIGANCYMFRHQDAVSREFINNKWSQVQPVYQALVAHTSIVWNKSLVDKLPEDGTLVPKRVALGT
jgi:hypothetical protein